MFLGCTVPVRGFNYELSVRSVAKKLGIEFVDIPGFSCCGFPLDSVHHDSSGVLAARNLALAEAQGLDIITLCSACTGHMTKIEKLVSGPGNAEEKKAIGDYLAELGLSYQGKSRVKHFVRFLFEDIGLDKLKSMVVKPLSGINIAPHYGCHYMKPSNIFDDFDDPIRPTSLDMLIEVTGAKSVQYKYKLRCCGGGILAVDEDSSIKMVKKKLDNVREADADAMTLMCPFCDIMYDEYQPSIESRYEEKYNIPVLYYSQVLGLAMGLHPRKELAVNKNRVKVKPLLKKIEGI